MRNLHHAHSGFGANFGLICPKVIRFSCGENFYFCGETLETFRDQSASSAVYRRFLVQISAQNLSQILSVCVKVCTKQTQKGVYLQRNPFRDKSEYSTKPFSRQNRLFVKLQLGHVMIGMIPAAPSMHENHAFDHKKIVNIVWKAHLFRHARQEERQKWMNV